MLGLATFLVHALQTYLLSSQCSMGQQVCTCAVVVLNINMADGRQVTAVIVLTWTILLRNAGNSWFCVRTFLETLTHHSPAMAQCTQSAFEFIQSAFCPMVAVMCSEDAEKVCQKNNLSFVEMVRPFCHLTSEGNYIKITVSWSLIRLLFDSFVSNLWAR